MGRLCIHTMGTLLCHVYSESCSSGYVSITVMRVLSYPGSCMTCPLSTIYSSGRAQRRFDKVICTYWNAIPL